MSGRRRIYETAFDSKVERPNEDLDSVTNHPLLQMAPLSVRNTAAEATAAATATTATTVVDAGPASASCSRVPSRLSIFTPKEGRRRVALRRDEGSSQASSVPKGIAPKAEVEDVDDNEDEEDLDEEDEARGSSVLLVQSMGELRPPTTPSPLRLPVGTMYRPMFQTPPPLSGYAPSPPPLRHSTPSPPSTAPLPLKFQNKDARINAIRSAPAIARQHWRPDEQQHEDHQPTGFWSVESMALSSSSSGGGSTLSSMESLRSTSTSSSSSRHSSCSLSGSSGGELSSSSASHHHHHYQHHVQRPRLAIMGRHSSLHALINTGGNTSSRRPRPRLGQRVKLHLLSPISDRSQEPTSEASCSDNNRNNNSQKNSPGDEIDLKPPASAAMTLLLSTAAVSVASMTSTVTGVAPLAETELQLLGDATKDTSSSSSAPRRRRAQNRNLLCLSLQASSEAEIQGSDSGISVESHEKPKVDEDFGDLPFDMPKLRRKLSVAKSPPMKEEIESLPFDIPKLRRRLRQSNSVTDTTATSACLESATSAEFSRTLPLDTSHGIRSKRTLVRPSLSLDLGQHAADISKSDLSLDFGFRRLSIAGTTVDPEVPLEKQGWYHGAIPRSYAEKLLHRRSEGSYLVRQRENPRRSSNGYSLSLKSARGFIHARIEKDTSSGQFRLADGPGFNSVPALVHHYTSNRLTLRGATHLCLMGPVIEQLL